MCKLDICLMLKDKKRYIIIRYILQHDVARNLVIFIFK